MTLVEEVQEILTEKSFFNQDKLLMISYAVVIAEIYATAPAKDSRVVSSYQATVENIEYLYDKIASKYGIGVEHSEDDPYESDSDMIQDIHKNKRIKVYTGHSDHPYYSPEINVKFRAIHDIFTHYTPNRRSIDQDKVNYRGNDFTYPGELDSYYTHMKYSKPVCHPAYFSEVVGQVSYQAVTGDFGEQKMVYYGDLADIGHIGVLKGKALDRQKEVYEYLRTGTEIRNSPLRFSTEALLKSPVFSGKGKV